MRVGHILGEASPPRQGHGRWGALGTTGQPGLEPSQQPTVNIGAWLNGPWGLQSRVPSEVPAAQQRGQLVHGLGTIVPSNQLSETDAREMGS